MTTAQAPGSFTARPGERTPQAAVTAREEHSLVLDDARAAAAYGQHSQAGKILDIHQELPGRTHIVLIRQPTGF